MKNFKVRCIRGYETIIKKGEIYKVKDGRFIFDNGDKSERRVNSVDELNDFFFSKFELVEKESLKVGDYVVTKKKIRPSKDRNFMAEMIVENPVKISKINYENVYFLESMYYGYEPHWLKKVERQKKKENLDGKNR